MNKFILVAAAIFLSGICALATIEFRSILITTKSGQKWALPTESLTMQPQGDKLVVTPSIGEALTLNLAELASATFSEEDVAGLNGVNIDGREVTFYTMQGCKVGVFMSVTEAKGVLPAGVYIVKTESGTSKYLLK